MCFCCCCCCQVASVVSDSVRPHRQQPTRLPRPRDSPGKTLEWVAISFWNAWKVKSESEDSQSCPILSDPMDCSPPGSSVHGIFQARVLEWGAIAFSTYVLLYVDKIFIPVLTEDSWFLISAFAFHLLKHSLGWGIWENMTSYTF